MNSASDWSSGAGRGSFSDQLHHLWQTRPVRMPRQGPIAGVAAGFGRRYNVDPVLVRVAFVISAFFGGAGIVLYLASWVLMRQEGDEASAAESLFGKGRSSQSHTKTIVLMVALGIAIMTAGPVGTGLGGSGLISFALMLGGWWLLYQRQPEPPVGSLDSGFAAMGYPTTTGYPGTAFPGSPQWTGYPGTTSPYGPYTTLPDHYEPDPARQAATSELRAEPPVREGDSNATARTEVLPKPDGSTGTGESGDGTAAASDDAPAPTVELSKGDPTTAKPLASDSTAPEGDPTPTEQSPERRTRTEVLRVKGDIVRGDIVESVTLRKDPSASTDELPNDDDASYGSGADDTPPYSPEPGRHPGESPDPHRIPSASEPERRSYGPAPISPDFRPTPPGWDPLGVAPLAWDLPEPSASHVMPVQAPPKRPRSRLTPTVIGLAILAAAGAGAAAAAGVDWMTPGRIGAAALAVVALGLIVGAFVRRGYGLMVVLAPLAGFVLLASLIGPIEFDRGGMGDRVWVVQDAAELAPEYSWAFGSATLDLNNLRLTEDRTTKIEGAMGEVRILVPNDLRVRFDCSVDMGEQNCPSGIIGPAEGPILDLAVDMSMGSVEVQRG
ncbi:MULTISPECIES: PspC domain-containing protein [unclassified Nocardia]|uniref:PspC domain-containing protein n=2 Tax=Nocardia TaxID=1817 RepID=UPI00278BDB3C|nr:MULTISPECIES: PspC domain-containing protein [unclassified Nocardia]